MANVLDTLVHNDIIAEMASELPADQSEWDIKYFSLHAGEEASNRGLDGYSDEMIATAVRQRFALDHANS